jgi:hypothetical protein
MIDVVYQNEESKTALINSDRSWKKVGFLHAVPS